MGYELSTLPRAQPLVRGVRGLTPEGPTGGTQSMPTRNAKLCAAWHHHRSVDLTTTTRDTHESAKPVASLLCRQK